MFLNKNSPGDLNDHAYAASATNTARSRGKQVRPDDGFHTRPVRSEQGWRRKAVMALAALMCGLIAIFVLRATGDRDEQIQDTGQCTDLFDAGTCEAIEP